MSAFNFLKPESNLIMFKIALPTLQRTLHSHYKDKLFGDCGGIAVPVHALKAQGGRRGIARLFFNSVLRGGLCLTSRLVSFN
jgi:hypothetical protein